MSRLFRPNSLLQISERSELIAQSETDPTFSQSHHHNIIFLLHGERLFSLLLDEYTALYYNTVFRTREPRNAFL